MLVCSADSVLIRGFNNRRSDARSKPVWVPDPALILMAILAPAGVFRGAGGVSWAGY